MEETVGVLMMNLRALYVCALVLSLVGCASRKAEERIRLAQHATAALYEQMSAQQYDAIYAEASSDFKKSISREEFTSFLNKLNQRAGVCGSPTPVLTSYHFGEPIVDLAYSRTCSKVGEIRDKFSWTIEDNRARLKGYFVENLALPNE